MNTFDYPEQAKTLKCENCTHSLAGHMDTAGNLITGCHFNWYDEPDMPNGCGCQGFKCPFVKLD